MLSTVCASNRRYLVSDEIIRFESMATSEFMSLLKHEKQLDVKQLATSMKEGYSLEDLVQHNPYDWLLMRPASVRYHAVSAVGKLGENLYPKDFYMMAKTIEVEYKVISPRILLPLSVTENLVFYSISRSKKLVNFAGRAAPGGMYDTIKNALQIKLATMPILVPSGLGTDVLDNDQSVKKNFGAEAYGKSRLIIVTSHGHSVVNPKDNFLNSRESYPGQYLYKKIEIKDSMEKVGQFLDDSKVIFRGERDSFINTLITDLESGTDHRNTVKGLTKRLVSFTGGKTCCVCGNVIFRSEAIKCTNPKCGLSGLVTITDAAIVTNYFEKLGSKNLPTRLEPAKGLILVEEPCVDGQQFLPGEPDLIPPTSYKNLAQITFNMAHRHGIKQVTGTGEKETLVSASDNSPFLMQRNLAAHTFRHCCGYMVFGSENMMEHLKTCVEVPSEKIDPLYQVEGGDLENCTRAFGFLHQLDGHFHFEYNSSMRIHDRLLQKIFGTMLPHIFGRESDKSILHFYKAGDHHKACITLEVVLYAVGFYLLDTYMESSSDPFTPENYYKWLDLCQNANIILAHNLCFGPLLSLMLFRAATRQNDGNVAMSAKFELAKIFFLKKANRNYQGLISHNIKDRLLLPDCWLQRLYSLHVSSKTVKSSVHIPPLPTNCKRSLIEEEDDQELLRSSNKTFVSTRKDKAGMGRFEGVDARLEEVNQISKDSEEAILDEGAWLRDFRMMVPKITLEKKLMRDQGEDETGDDKSAIHTRSNYREIVILEAKLRQYEWLDNPFENKDPTTADGTGKLNVDSINFWIHAANNARCGISQLICGQKVSFEDIDIADDSSARTDDVCSDFQGLKAKITKLLNTIPDDCATKPLYMDYNNSVIINLSSNSPSANLVEEFYFILLEYIDSLDISD